MIETPTEDRKRSKTLVIVIVLFACLGGLCLLGVIGYVGYSYLGLSIALGTGPTPQSAVVIPSGDTPSVDATTAPGDADIQSGDLLALMEDGSIAVEGINVPVNDLLGNPPEPDFKIYNPDSRDFKVTIPCGLILMPPAEAETKLMVYQKAEATVPAGQAVNVELMVTSIEASKQMPTGTGDYTVGTMVEGDLLIFAGCLCSMNFKERARTRENWYSEVLFATWSVSDNFPISLMMENMGLYAAFTGGTPSCLETVFPEAESIVNTCGLTPWDPMGTKPPPGTKTP